MNPALIPLDKPDELRAHGLPFPTVHSARWAFRTREEKGLAAAFVRIGRRVFVDPQRFHELAREPELPAPKKAKSKKAHAR